MDLLIETTIPVAQFVPPENIPTKKDSLTANRARVARPPLYQESNPWIYATIAHEGAISKTKPPKPTLIVPFVQVANTNPSTTGIRPPNVKTAQLDVTL